MSRILSRADKRQITTGTLSEDAVDKIKQVVQAEGGQCEITSPMEKLETFFVRTVTEAEKHAEPTSGAVISKGMGFLAPESLDSGAAESILDKLVDATLSPDTTGTPADSEKVREIEPEQVNKSVLEELSKPAESNSHIPGPDDSVAGDTGESRRGEEQDA
jgi:hypothetical protein